MENFDVLVGKRATSTPASIPQPPARRLGQYWDALAVLLLLVATLPAAWLSPRMLVLVRDTSLIDDNWHLDASFKASRGIWIGRDVAFTHGPIFQWLSSVPARSMGFTMGALYATWNTVPVWCAFVFGYLTLRLLIPEQPPWKRFLLLLLLCIFWSPSLRNSFAIFLFALFLRGWYAVAEGRSKGYLFGSAAALLCACAFLLAADTGTYAIAAVVISLAGVAVETRGPRALNKLMWALPAFVVCAAVLVLAINAAMAKPFGFQFWKDTAEMVSAYRWATPARMTHPSTVHLLGTLVIGAAIFLFRAARRLPPNPATTARIGFLLGGFAFALVMMQSGLVRSDHGHIVTAEFAMVFLAGAILFSFESIRASAVAVLFAVACSMLFARPAFPPSTVIHLFADLRHPLTSCPSGYSEFDRGCFAPEFTGMLQSASRFLSQHSGPQDPMLVFPYQTMFGIASQRNVAGGLMQAYTASGPYLSQLEIAGLERAAPLVGLYLPDPDLRDFSEEDLSHWRNLDLSLAVDGVSNFARTPEVWFWLVRHYRSEQQLSTGVFGLQRDDSRAARITMQPQALGLPPLTYPVQQRSSVVDLGSPDWPRGADFLRLRITVTYGFLWKLRKPERMQLEITRADGSRDFQWFVLQPNVSTEVWFYPWSPPGLVHYFDADESHWRTGPRPAITRLRLVATPFDWVSQQPSTVTVESADAVRVTMSGQRTN
jgi:hypothetical protein